MSAAKEAIDFMAENFKHAAKWHEYQLADMHFAYIKGREAGIKQGTTKAILDMRLRIFEAFDKASDEVES